MFFDDLSVGYSFETASRTLSEEAITGFARQWDPQFFHTDPEAAKTSPYGGLIASGFQTLLVMFVAELEADQWTEASLGSPGFDELRWLRPVRPGDTLTKRVEVIAARPSASKPDRGVATFAHSVRNQHGEEVMSYRSIVILRRRPDGS